MDEDEIFEVYNTAPNHFILTPRKPSSQVSGAAGDSYPVGSSAGSQVENAGLRSYSEVEAARLRLEFLPWTPHMPVALDMFRGNNVELFPCVSLMSPLAQDPVTVGTDSSASTRSPDGMEEMFASLEAGRKLYNLPSRSEKLTDATLPLSWPVPYLDSIKAVDEVPSLNSAETSVIGTRTAPVARAQEDYAQLICKLRAESALARGNNNGDKALYAAHYISTLIAALAFIAMVGIVILNFFPALTQS